MSDPRLGSLYYTLYFEFAFGALVLDVEGAGGGTGTGRVWFNGWENLSAGQVTAAQFLF